MAKLTNYSGSVELISGIKQKNNGNFPLMEANAIQIDNDGKISKIFGWQIVNGGQTTASIYNAYKGKGWSCIVTEEL